MELLKSAKHISGVQKPVLLREGKDAAIIATGFMTHRSVQAAELMSKEGINAAVVHVPYLKSLDLELVVKIAGQCGAVGTAENHSIVGDLAGYIRNSWGRVPVPMKRV